MSKNTENSASDKLDVAQWRDVFSQVDALLSEPAERRRVDGDLQLSRPQSARDDQVDSVVRHWAQASPSQAKTLGNIAELVESGNTVLTGPTEQMRLGHYRLLERIGQGGMGSVWRAERTDGLYQAQVAIKLLGTLALSAHARARFALEGQILARLIHPHIARLLDAGTTDDGQRFLVIELIDGVAINDYVAREKLTVNARLQLFRQLLDAVAFAHERLVIHRDIKPANIVVTGMGEVKLLDFGVAKLLVDNHDEASLTQLHGSAYTEAYAAPEQMRGEPPAVSADVFSLGMILFELVTGQRATWTQPKSYVQRGARAEEIGTVTPADLAAVIGKALEVAVEDRYRSVPAMDDDIRRLLASEPVTAHTAGAMYSMAKFARRNRAAVATTLAVMLALMTGAAVATWQWRAAKSQAARAEAVQEFMAKLFEDNDPENTRGTPLTAKELLERGATRVVGELKNQPDVLAELQVRIGGIYNSLGEHEKARPHLESAIAYFEATGGTASTHYLDALFSLTESDVDARKFDAVRAVAGKLRTAAKAAFGEPNKWLGNTLGQLSWSETKSGDAVRGELLAREGLAQQREWTQGIAADADTLGIANNLIEALIYQGKFVEARLVAASKVAEGPTVAQYKTTDQLVDRYVLARLDFILNRYLATAIELQSLVDEMGRHLGIKHPRTVTARNLLAQSLVFAGFESEGVAVQRSNVIIAQSRDTADAEAVAFERAVLAKLLVATVQPAAAETEANELVAVITKNYPTPTWNAERARWIVGDAQLHQRKFAEAEQTLSLTISNMQSLTAFAQSPGYAEALQSRALLAHAQRQGAAALKDITEACAIFEKKLPVGAAQTARCALYASWIASKLPTDEAARADAARALPQLKTQLLALIPEGHAQRAALAAILKLIESTSDTGAADRVREWPISLVEPHP